MMEVNGCRILVVATDQLYRNVVCMMVNSFGLGVRDAGNARDAFHMLGNERFDLVITDGWLPDADGIVFARAVKDKFPGIKVVLMTGAKLDSTACSARASIDIILLKPFTVGDLKTAISRLIPSD